MPRAQGEMPPLFVIGPEGDDPLFTGFTRDGGFATATFADARFAFPLGESGDDRSLAVALRWDDRLAFAVDCR